MFWIEIEPQSPRAPEEVLFAKTIYHCASKIFFEISEENLFQPNDALRLIYRVMILVCFKVQA